MISYEQAFVLWAWYEWRESSFLFWRIKTSAWMNKWMDEWIHEYWKELSYRSVNSASLCYFYTWDCFSLVSSWPCYPDDQPPLQELIAVNLFIFFLPLSLTHCTPAFLTFPIPECNASGSLPGSRLPLTLRPNSAVTSLEPGISLPSASSSFSM